MTANLTTEEREILHYLGRDQTARRIEIFRANGWEIHDGNDYRLPDRPLYAGRDVVRLCQTNHRRHGKCVRTVFAVRQRAEA
jgi:hypothetical protein